MLMLDIRLLLYQVSRIYTEEAQSAFTLCPCPGLNIVVIIAERENCALPTYEDQVWMNGICVGNRHGAREAFLRAVMTHIDNTNKLTKAINDQIKEATMGNAELN